MTSTDLDSDPGTAPERPRPRRRRRALRTALVLLVALVGVVIAFAAVAGTLLTNVANSFDARRTAISTPFPTGPRPPADATGAMNILLMGSDSRGAPTVVGDASATNQRSDTLMLVHIAADRRSVQVMSIMRDSWVPIPGHGTAKINAAFAYGGTALTVQTVEQLLGVRIDHVAVIDFAGFKGMTNALGGVDVVSEHDFSNLGHTFHQGVNHLDGDAAFAFVQDRKSFADADHQRVRDQQAFLKAISDSLISRSTLTDPARIGAFIDATSEYLSVDPGLDFRTIVGIGWSLRSVQAADVTYFTMPTAGGGRSADGQSYVSLDPTVIARLRTALQDDQVAAFAGSGGAADTTPPSSPVPTTAPPTSPAVP